MSVADHRLGALRAGLDSRTLVQKLDFLSRSFPQRAVFSTSFGLEDQAITHLIFSNDLPIRVFTLDTGRLFPETYATWSRTLDRYQKPVEAFAPRAAGLEKLLNAQGPNGFYRSVDARQACCRVRKVEPLARALSGQALWITGIRADQSAGRGHLDALEWDRGYGLFKFHPLFDWSFGQVREFVALHNVPYNPLHDRGFVSIGCAPCTRAIQEGEDFRAGRWWWEDQEKKECGLHLSEQ
jgi:phosphoadenosine phosphosulfate reductase